MQRTRTLGPREIVALALLSYLLLVVVVVNDASGRMVPLIRPILAVGFLSLVPGLLAVTLLGMTDHSTLYTLLYGVGLSLCGTMLIGVLISLLGPLIGVSQPISVGWLLVCYGFIVLAAAGWIWQRVEQETPVMVLPRVRSTFSTPIFLLLSCLPLFSILAVGVLNRVGDNRPLIVLLIFLSALPALSIYFELDERWFPFIVWTIGLALLYHGSLWRLSYPIEMWGGYVTLDVGRWLPSLAVQGQYPQLSGVGQESLLPVSVLFPIYAEVAGIPLMTQLRAVNPLFVSLIPLVTYAIANKYLDAQDALLTVILLIFSFRFYIQHYPNAARDVSATLFLGLLGLLIADDKATGRVGGFLAGVFAFGVITSHYGTAYLLIFILFIAVITKKGVQAISESSVLPWSLKSTRCPSHTFLSPGFVIYVGGLTFVWYLFTAGGIKVFLLERVAFHLTQGAGLFGPTAQLITVERSVTIDILRYIYLAFGGMIGIGILYEGIRRFWYGHPRVPLDHLGMSIGMLFVLLLTLFPIGTGFDTGRILMVFLPFIGLFAITTIRSLLSKSWQTIVQRLGRLQLRNSPTCLPRLIIAFLLASLLLLSTGVSSELVTHDYAPSNVVTEQRLQQSQDKEFQWRAHGCIDCDIDQLLWLLEYGNHSKEEYTGSRVKGWYWYSASIVSQLDNFIFGSLMEDDNLISKRDLLTESDNISPGDYIRLNRDNIVTNQITGPRGDRHSTSRVCHLLNNSHQVYTNGKGKIYVYTGSDRTDDCVPEAVET